MKTFFITCGLLIGVFMTESVMAAAPATTCPVGYMTVRKRSIVLSNDNCASGTFEIFVWNGVRTNHSCLVASPLGVCILYAPADTDYSDGSGTYQFTQICDLTL